jgi:hypothetical protein
MAIALVNADSVLADRLAQLAPAVQAKFRHLDDARNDLSDAVDGTQRRWEEAREPLMRARIAATSAAEADKHDMGRLARQRHTGRPEPPSHEAQATAARLAQAEDGERARRAARDDALQRFTVAQQLLAGCQALIRSTDPAQLAPILLTRGGTPKKSGDVAAELDRLRAGIAQVAAERTALDRAPVTHEEASRRLDSYLDVMAREWTPTVATDFAQPAFHMPSPDDYGFPHKAIFLLANLPEVRAALHARLRSAYERLPASVPTAERPARVADLDARQRQFELAEERIVLEAALAGHAIPRRADASPRIVLCATLSE